MRKKTLIVHMTLGALLPSSLAWAAGETPRIDSGDTAWLLVSTAMVMLMTPGLALFYGGMTRRKNVLNTIMLSFVILCMVSVQWILWGYTLAFGPDKGGIIGGLSFLGFRGVGLDPAVGFLHCDRPGRPGLALDLMEEYRPVFTDTLVITLVNRKVIGKDDFVYRNVPDTSFESEEELKEKRPVEMKPEVMKGFIEIFERKLETRIRDPQSGNQVTYRYLVELQVRRFARLVLGEADA